MLSYKFVLGLLATFVQLYAASAVKDQGSPVEKVIQLLQTMEEKVKVDAGKDATTMEEYLQYCSDESKEKGFAMKNADRSIAEQNAVIEENKARIVELDDEISTLGSVISGKEKELEVLNANRKAESSDFETAEQELVASVDACARAAKTLEEGMSLAQVHGKLRVSKKLQRKLNAVQMALTSIASAAWIDAESAQKLKSFLQQSEGQADAASDDISLSLDAYQPQGKQVAYESKSDVIVESIKQMEDKAKTELTELRKKEVKNRHNFEMLSASIMSEIKQEKEKLATSTAAKSSAQEASNQAEGEMVETQKTKAADQEYSESLKMECQTQATSFEARQRSAKEEVGALQKAREILAGGVTAFIQVRSNTRRIVTDEGDGEQEVRNQVVQKLRAMGRRLHSFAMMEMASAVASDPFVKIRSLIEDMIASLTKQAEAEATQKAFCDTELGKSKQSKEQKEVKQDKYQARIDKAVTTIGELESQVKDLEKDLAELDKGSAEASRIRVAEKEENSQSMKDYKDSADAVIKAIGVLKKFYGGDSFLQTSGDGSGIISVLEMAESDYTRLFAETEAAESEAAGEYEKLVAESKVSKATKLAELKGKTTEIKSFEVALTQAKDDHSSVSQELDAVLAYMDKLKPQCETKAMSYEEKVSRRNAEIDGLKDALDILSGKSLALLESGNRSFRRVN